MAAWHSVDYINGLPDKPLTCHEDWPHVGVYNPSERQLIVSVHTSHNTVWVGRVPPGMACYQLVSDRTALVLSGPAQSAVVCWSRSRMVLLDALDRYEETFRN